MTEKPYHKSELDQERIEELFLEITGKRVLPKKEMIKLDAFFERDENGNISLYYREHSQNTVNQQNNDRY